MKETVYNANGKVLKSRTKFQRGHAPKTAIENKCHGATDVRGICTCCGRGLSTVNSVKVHNPNKTGSLGYVLTYSDGSKVVTTGK